ncbi:MAG: YggS family pyridoxal phosphate-dependent enzyme [Sporichthyaceae bacterium]
MAEDARRAELAANLAAVRARIAAACATVGRDPADVTLIAVTKGHPPADVAHLAALGVWDVAENRDAEAAAKARECAALRLRWHFVGQIQTNKARSVVSYADVVHALDRERLVRALDAAVLADPHLVQARDDLPGEGLAVLLQIDLDSRPGAGTSGGAGGRGGIAPEQVSSLAATVDRAEGLVLRGVMAIAPRKVPAGPAFARLAEISAQLRSRYPSASWISAGMSSDLHDAVRAGATHVRVGRSLLGPRPLTR